MNKKWLRAMILLLVIMTMLPAQAYAMEEISVEVPFSVVNAPGDVVIEAIDGAPLPEKTVHSGVSEGVFTMYYTEPDNYCYRVYQKAGTDKRFAYDETTVYRVMVTVMVNENGGLYAFVTVEIEGADHKPESVKFENTMMTGGLSITKTVSGSDADKDRQWHFTITLSEALNGTYGSVVFKDGVGHVALKHGETVTVEGLPVGTDYEVTEDEADKDGYTTTAEGAEGTIEDAAVSEVVFVNERSVSPTEKPSESPNPSNTPSPSSTPNPSNPRTGDTAQTGMWLGLAGLCTSALAYILLRERRRRSGGYKQR